MATTAFHMQLRSATAREAKNLVHHHEHTTINGRRALKLHLNNAPNRPKTLTLYHHDHSSSLKLRLGKNAPNTTKTEKLVHHHEHIIHHNRRALKVYMTSGAENPRSLTFIHQPRSGIKLRLRLGKHSPEEPISTTQPFHSRPLRRSSRILVAARGSSILSKLTGT